MTTIQKQKEVYNDEIMPLVEQVFKLCEQHNIAMIASFSIADHEKKVHELSTSAMLKTECDPPAQFYMVETILSSNWLDLVTDYPEDIPH